VSFSPPPTIFFNLASAGGCPPRSHFSFFLSSPKTLRNPALAGFKATPRPLAGEGCRGHTPRCLEEKPVEGLHPATCLGRRSPVGRHPAGHRYAQPHAKRDGTPVGAANPRGSPCPRARRRTRSRERGRAPVTAAGWGSAAVGAALPGAAGAAVPGEEPLRGSCRYFQNKEGAGAVATGGRGCSQPSTSRFLSAACVALPGISDAKLALKLPCRKAFFFFF